MHAIFTRSAMAERPKGIHLRSTVSTSSLLMLLDIDRHDWLRGEFMLLSIRSWAVNFSTEYELPE